MNLPNDASNDQSNCPDGYYRRANGMVHQLSQNPSEADSSRLTELDLLALDAMTKEQLISLIKRVSGAMWGIGIMTDEQAYEAARLKLIAGGLNEKDVWKALPALKEWFDRTKGKPAQSVAMTIEDKGISKLSTERLLALEKELARMTGQDAIVIAPMPQKLTD